MILVRERKDQGAADGEWKDQHPMHPASTSERHSVWTPERLGSTGREWRGQVRLAGSPKCAKGSQAPVVQASLESIRDSCAPRARQARLFPTRWLGHDLVLVFIDDDPWIPHLAPLYRNGIPFEDMRELLHPRDVMDSRWPEPAQRAMVLVRPEHLRDLEVLLEPGEHAAHFCMVVLAEEAVIEEIMGQRQQTLGPMRLRVFHHGFESQVHGEPPGRRKRRHVG